MNTKTDFTIKVLRQMMDDGFSILLHNKESIDGYGGWLEADGEDKELCVAMKHHMGFEILLHEYCHYLQYKNDRSFWDSSNDYYDLLFDWSSNQEVFVKDIDLDKSLETIIKIEHDCEKRALKLVSLNPVDEFDFVKYKKAANAYLWSYHVMREIRKKPQRPIYSERVLVEMDPVFNPDVEFYLNKNNLSDTVKKALMLEFTEE